MSKRDLREEMMDCYQFGTVPDPDLGKIERGHVCKHGIRWPHACDKCDEAAWAASQGGDDGDC